MAFAGDERHPAAKKFSTASSRFEVARCRAPGLGRGGSSCTGPRRSGPVS